RFAPQLPADWDRVSATRVPVAGGPVEVTLVRGAGRLSVTVARPSGGGSPLKIVLAPAFPLDARVHSVSAGPLQVTRLGDVQRAEATLELRSEERRVGKEGRDWGSTWG